VCGVTVPPLTVWHTFALENIGNHYLCGGPCDKNDAASLLLFARLDYAHGRDMVLPNRQFFRARQEADMYRRLVKQDWGDIHAACKEYVDHCMRSQSRWQNGEGGKPAAVPYQWHLVRMLSMGDPAKIEDAWNTAYAVARCMFDAQAEMAGDRSLLTTVSQEMEDNWEHYKPQEETA
jgi:hypothetical protein